MNKKQEITLSIFILLVIISAIIFNVYNVVFATKTLEGKKIDLSVIDTSVIEKEMKKNIEEKNILKKEEKEMTDEQIISELTDKDDKYSQNEVSKILKAAKFLSIPEEEIGKKVIDKIPMNINLTKNEILNEKEIKKQKLKKKEEREGYCENLSHRLNTKEDWKNFNEHNCDIKKTRKRILNIKTGLSNNLKTTIKHEGRLQAINIWKDRTNIIIDKYGKNPERVLDLLTIMTMECNRDKGKCYNSSDIGPFQINQVHKEWYNKSYQFYIKKQWNKLFLYQLDKANKLLDSYEKGGCSDYNIKHYGIGKTYKEKRWRCIAFRYNGHPKYKYGYNKLGLKKRNIIEKFLIENKILK